MCFVLRGLDVVVVGFGKRSKWAAPPPFLLLPSCYHNKTNHQTTHPQTTHQQAFATANPAVLPFVAVSTGTGSKDIAKLAEILTACPGVQLICMDVANGYSEHFSHCVRTVRLCACLCVVSVSVSVSVAQ